MSPRAQITLFMGIIVGVGLPMSLLMGRMGGPDGSQGSAFILAGMWLPGLAAMATRLVAARSLRGMGWGPGPGRYYLLAYLLPLIYGGAPFVIAVASGNGRWNPDAWARIAADHGVPASAALGLVALLSVDVLGNLAGGLGEEIGWRGFLVPVLARSLGFWGVAAASWVIWLVFHLPVILALGYRPAGTPLWMSLLAFGAMLAPVSVMMAWLRLKSGSLWPAALAHAAHNAFILDLFGPGVMPGPLTPWLVAEFGAITPVAALVVVGATLLTAGGVPRSGPVVSGREEDARAIRRARGPGRR